MLKYNNTKHRGFTIVELMITMAIMIIVAASIGGVIVENQRSWGAMYAQVNSDIASGGFAASKKFDTVIRGSLGSQIQISGSGQWVKVNYYASGESTSVDRYGEFYTSNGTLYYEYGQLSPKQTIAVETICSNVSKCIFRKEGLSVQMILTLDDGEHQKKIVTSALAHN